MKFIIKPLIGNTDNLQEIDEPEYQQIITHRERLFDILLFEEKFAYIINNFYELETEALKVTVPILSSYESVSTIVNDTHVFNRRIMNLLTTCRSYLDQIPSNLESISDIETNIKQQFEDKKKQYIKQSFTYYFFWQLRNYAQHRDIPLKGNKRKISKIDQKYLSTDIERRVVEHTLEFNIDVKELLIDPKFFGNVPCSSFKQKLQESPKNLNIRPLIREYVSILAKIHEEFRQKLNIPFKQSENLIKEKIKYYCQQESSDSCFEILKKDEQGDIIERFDIFLRPVERRENMIRKYCHLDAIANQYVTSG